MDKLADEFTEQSFHFSILIIIFKPFFLRKFKIANHPVIGGFIINFSTLFII